jgi:hypothetical protein
MRAFGRAQVGIFRKVVEHGLVDAGYELAIEGDPEQQRDHALRRRPDVVLDGRTVLGVGDGLIPDLVVAFAVVLEGQRAVADHHDAVDVAGTETIEPFGHGAKAAAVDADGFRRRGSPAIRDISRRAAAGRLGRCRERPPGSHRRQCRAETCGHRSARERAGGNGGEGILRHRMSIAIRPAGAPTPYPAVLLAPGATRTPGWIVIAERRHVCDAL